MRLGSHLGHLKLNKLVLILTSVHSGRLQARRQTFTGDLSLWMSCERTLATQACLRHLHLCSLPCIGVAPASFSNFQVSRRIHSAAASASLLACPETENTTTRCRYLRQESPLWSALHQGLLSGSSINAVLGFYEPQAAKRLGIPGGYVGHGKLLSAYRNLQLPAYVPSPADMASLCSPQPQQWQQSSPMLPSASVPSEQHSAEASGTAAGAEPGEGGRGSAEKGGHRKRRGRMKGAVLAPAAGQAMLGTHIVATYARVTDAEKQVQLQRMGVCMRKAAEGVLTCLPSVAQYILPIRQAPMPRQELCGTFFPSSKGCLSFLFLELIYCSALLEHCIWAGPPLTDM